MCNMCTTQRNFFWVSHITSVASIREGIRSTLPNRQAIATMNPQDTRKLEVNLCRMIYQIIVVSYNQYSL